MLNFILHTINLMFVSTGINDYRRKLFFQQSLSALLSPARTFNDPDFYAEIPSINITDPNSIRRWMFLRRATLDLGKKFTTRVYWYCSAFLAIYGLMGLFFILTFFKLISYNIPIRFTILCAYDILIVLGIILIMLNVGAKVNEHFGIHKGILLGIKHVMIKTKLNYAKLCEKEVFD